MKLSLRQIPPDGQYLEGEDTGDILQIDDLDAVRALGPLHYALDIGSSENGLWATGRIGMDVELQCVRCLEMFGYPVRIDDFAFQTDLEGQETIDLTPQLREDILLALPAYPHCDWSGEKVCPADLKAPESSGQSEPAAGAGQDRPSAWQTLDQLKTPSN